jgi:NADH-quinone oxidoreductase subunit H
VWFGSVWNAEKCFGNAGKSFGDCLAADRATATAHRYAPFWRCSPALAAESNALTKGLVASGRYHLDHDSASRLARYRSVSSRIRADLSNKPHTRSASGSARRLNSQRSTSGLRGGSRTCSLISVRRRVRLVPHVVCTHSAASVNLVLRAGAGLALALGMVGTFIYLCLYKMVSFMQSRLGPMEAGPYGSFQLLADFIKMIQKEDLVPGNSDSFVFKTAPFVALLGPFLMIGPMAISPSVSIMTSRVGVVYVIAVSSISTLAALMAGWSSANKYSLIGSLRAAGQLIAYELPIIMATVAVVARSGSMDLGTIAQVQQSHRIFDLPILGAPNAIVIFPAFLVFIVSMQAESMQAPFDMPVAESELVAGFLTEYSGARYLFFFMAEMLSVLTHSALAAFLFLGGFYLPGISSGPGLFWALLGLAVLLAKTLLVAAVSIWIRFSFPRFREDQLQSLAWKVGIPVSLLTVMIVGLFKVAF